MAAVGVNLCRPAEAYEHPSQQRITNRQRDQHGKAMQELMRDPEPLPPLPPRSKSLTSKSSNMALPHRYPHDLLVLLVVRSQAWIDSRSLEPVKNYAQENRRLLRQLATEQKDKIQARITAAQRLPKPTSRYDNVESKVFQETEVSGNIYNPRQIKYIYFSGIT